MRFESRGGMTLMELMVAVAITGAAAALGYQAFASIVDHRDRIRAATAESERAAVLRETLREWLTSGRIMIQTSAPPPIGSAGTSDVLTFMTTALTPSMGPSTFVRLFIDDDPATAEQGLTMEYRTTQRDSLLIRELAPAVGGMQVEFLDERTTRWYPAFEAATIRPMAVRVTLAGTSEMPLPPILEPPFLIMMQDEPERRPT